MKREELAEIGSRAVATGGGEATIVQVAEYIWRNHEADLKASGDQFYTWQYEMRWAAQSPRSQGKLELGRKSGKNTWRKVGN
jgi:hypothetical protein